MSNGPARSTGSALVAVDAYSADDIPSGAVVPTGSDDGIADLAVGAPGARDSTGRVMVESVGRVAPNGDDPDLAASLRPSSLPAIGVPAPRSRRATSTSDLGR